MNGTRQGGLDAIFSMRDGERAMVLQAPETPPNMLANRDRANIERIEASFRTGALGQAMKECPQIERRRGLDPATFDRDFRAQGRPVVVEGLMADWPALREWSFESLAARCGTTKVVVDSYTSQSARAVTFGEFVPLLRRSTEH